MVETKFRRKHPRRDLAQSIGLLTKGRFQIVKSQEIGEGGLAFSLKDLLLNGSRVVITFQLPNGPHISTRAAVRSQLGERVGIEFDTLPFETRKEIRAFVSAFSNC